MKPPRRAWYALLRGRVMSLLFVMLLGGDGRTRPLVASSLISALSARTVAALDGLWRLANVGVPLALMTVLFAGLFKLLPSAETRWRDLWIGAAITSLLFTLGRLLIGFYVGRAGVASAYGAAGAVIGGDGVGLLLGGDRAVRGRAHAGGGAPARRGRSCSGASAGMRRPR